MTSQAINIRAGRVGSILIISLALMALLAGFLSDLAFWLQSIFALIVLSVAVHAWFHWPIHRRWADIRPRHDGLLQLTTVDGRKILLEPTRKVFISPFFMAFGVREAGRRAFFIGGFYDQFEPDQYRRLLSWMRFGI